MKLRARINSFLTNIVILYSLKTPENLISIPPENVRTPKIDLILVNNAPNQYRNYHVFAWLQTLGNKFNWRIIRTFGAAGGQKGLSMQYQAWNWKMF